MNYGHHVGMMRLPRFLSDISYSLYLIHGPVGLLILAKLHGRIGYGNAAVLALVAVLALAYIIHWMVERPFIEWGRLLSNRFRPAQRVVAG